jgi:hypothetical protein
MAIADVLREFADKFVGIDNGRCTVCRVGHRLWKVPGKVKGPCDYESCLSHRINGILDRYEKPSEATLESIRQKCLERITQECFCGTELEAGICPNGHDPIQGDVLVDDVQRRMDSVAEAAVEWHQAGREGAEWFDKAEALSAAIDRLLELRETPRHQN